MSDEEGYPTEEELEKVRRWNILHPSDDDELKHWGPYTGTIEEWFAYIKSIGNYWPEEFFGWREEDVSDDLSLGKPVHRYYISTGGWSGNEDIISAMEDNRLNWHLTWRWHRWGGHYAFDVTKGFSDD